MDFFNKPDKRISVDNYYKNHDTGEFKQFLKQKNVSSMKNFAKVELFDELTGNKKEEWLSENIINNGLDMYMYKFVINSLLGQYMYAGFEMYNTFNPFGNIVLTDYSGAEDATLARIQGNIKGWANKFTTYAGADALRGTINQTDSSLTPETSLKYVFDWATSAGNGTFRTLWWMPQKMDAVTTSPLRVNSTIRFDTSALGTAMTTAANRFCVNDNKMYYINGTTIYSAPRHITVSSGGWKATSTSEKNITADDNTPIGIDFDGTNFWVYGDQNDKFYKYNSSFTLQTSWSATKGTYFGTNPTFCCHGGKIYTWKRVDATNWNLYKFATDGTLEATYNLYSAGYTYFTDTDATSARICSDGNNIFIIFGTNSSHINVLEVNGSGTLQYEYRSDFTLMNTSSGFCFDEYKNLLISYSATTQYSFMPMWRPTAQTLLGTNVTKTNSNTMKITYTFTLDTSSLTT